MRILFSMLAKRMAVEGFDVSRWTVHRWSKQLQSKRFKVSPKPQLCTMHRVGRIDHTLDDIDPATSLMFVSAALTD